MLPLVLLASARQNSETEKFVKAIFRDIEVELVNLLDHEIAPYSYDHTYPATDGFLALAGKVLQHQVVVMATPVYWYAMSSHLKVFFDRMTDLTETHKPMGKALKGKILALLAVGTDAEAPEGFEVPFARTAQYFGMHYAGFAYCQTKNISNTESTEKIKAGFLGRLSI